MTAIPEPTEEDFEKFKRLVDYVENGPEVIHDDRLGSVSFRIAVHYQRENERLARQRDVLREWLKDEPRLIKMERKVKEETGHDINAHKPGSSYLLACSRIDALEGEGGAA